MQVRFDEICDEMDFSIVFMLIRTICCLHPFVCFVFSCSFVIKQEPPTKLTVFCWVYFICEFHFLWSIYFFAFKPQSVMFLIEILYIYFYIDYIYQVFTFVPTCTTFATNTCMYTYSASTLYIRSYKHV